MKVTIIDNSTQDQICTADIRPDHFTHLALRQQIVQEPIFNSEGAVIGSRAVITHTNFINYLQEAAL